MANVFWLVIAAYEGMPLFGRSRCVNPFLLTYLFLLCTQQSILVPDPVETSPYQNVKASFKRVHGLDTPILFVDYRSKLIGSANQLFPPPGVSNSIGRGMTPTSAALHSLPSFERSRNGSLIRRFRIPIYGQQQHPRSYSCAFTDRLWCTLEPEDDACANGTDLWG